MAIKKKQSMQDYVFSGISAVYAVKDGITTSGGTATVAEGDVVELPVSEDSGFDFNGGEPTVNHFRVHGLQADWVSSFTPGDGTLTLQIPCHDDDVLDLVYGNTGTATTLTLPSDITVGGKSSVTGKARSFEQKAVYLGLLVLDDTAAHLLFIKKAKFIATPAFDGGDTPYAITLTGALAATSDDDAYGILEPATGA